MTKNDLYIAISGIDEDLLERSEISLEAHPTRFRRVPFVLIAAIISMLLMGAAGIVTIYKLVTGSSIVQTDDRFSVDFSTDNAPAVLENGRLWFIADDQRVDITDQISIETPYIYTTLNPKTQQTSYIIIGGTPENFGYAEIWKNQGVIGFAGRQGEFSMMMELTEEQFDQGLWIPPVEDIKWKWLYNAITQLEAEL